MRYIIAKDDGEFDRILRDTNQPVAFDSELDEHTYVAKDQRLIDMIQKVCAQVVGSASEGQIHQIQDWWPNQTRYVDCNLQVFTERLRKELQQLIQGEYDNWRIQIVVYRDMMVGTTQIGSLVMNSDWWLVDRLLHDELELSKEIP